MNVSKKIVKAAALSLALCLAGLSSSQAAVQKEIRISGSDRIATAIKIADEFGKTDNVIIATADSYADALVASPMATEMNAPILLNRGNSLDGRVLKKIEELGAKNVTIVGGTGSIGSGVENELKSSGMNVSRISGRNRYSTSAEIASKYNQMVKAKDVVVASGENFPDALVAGPYASKIKSPIILSKKNSVTEEVKRVHSEINPTRTIAVGGVSSLNPYNLKITDRIAGNNRYETALKVAKFMSGEKAYIASGEIFADSLVAAPLAAKTQSPILLRAKYTVQNNIKDYVNNKTESLITVGGASTVESGIKEKKPVKIEQKNQKVQPEQKAQQEQKVQPNQKTQQEQKAQPNQKAQQEQKVQPNKKPVKKLTREEKDRKLQEVKKELHRMINEYRRSKGVKELEWSKEGEKGSNIRAEEISRLFSHTRPNGERCGTAFDYMSDVWGSGENIEYLPNNLIETKSPKEIAKIGFELWKNSDGHNRNMLNIRYDEQSLGVYEKDRVLYISENLFIKNIEIERPKEDTTPKKSNQMSNDEFNRIKPEIKRIFINKINDQRRENGLKPLVHESDFQRTPTECGYINSVFKKEIQCSLDYAIETKGHGGVDAEEIGNKIFEDAKEKENYSFNSKDYVAYNFTVDYENGNIEYSLVMIKEVINKYDLGIYTVEK